MRIEGEGGMTALVGPGRARPWLRTAGVAAAAVGVGGLAAELTDNVVDADGATRFDRPVLDWVLAHRVPGLDPVAVAVTDAGGTPAMAVLALVAIGWLLLLRRRSQALLVAVAALGAAALVTVIKNAVGRVRPPLVDQLVVETNPSFPSGHTLGSTVVIGVVAAVLVAMTGRALARVAIVATAAVAVLLIGLSRLYLGVHWTSDVLQGWLLGALWLGVCLAAAGWWRRRPVAARGPA
jgi:undecaprenyl-diphosphatase